MYLKRIELEGFKSFADRTVIPVERGLTGIVGPNGMGKSNVVDALLWVLGERSTKTLRADSMEDVIFKGTASRAASPYAMVEIVLGDDEGKVAEPGGEVAVGRRLFRTGESEFLLHGRKVRRKDVHELLMDTGLGVRGYMVLAQGKIEAILDENPVARRSVFEEAAGISRYKERKKETERKLSHVDNDLTRVEDILGEVKRSVRSLRVQAGKAQRYLEMRDRYRDLRVRVSLVEASQYQEEETDYQMRAKSLGDDLEGFRVERESANQTLNSLVEEEGVLRERFDSLRQESSSNKEETARLEGHINGLEARVVELSNREEGDSSRLFELQSLGKEASREALQLQSSVATAQQEKETSESTLQMIEERYGEVRTVHRGLQASLETLRGEILETLAERTRCNNKLAEAAKARSEAAGALKSVNRRLEELVPTLTALQGDVSSKSEACAIAREKTQESQAMLHVLMEQRTALQGEEKGYSETAGDASRRAASARARLEALAGLEEDFQGLPSETRDLLQSEESNYELLLNQVEVPAPWDRLLENLLGRLQHSLWGLERPVPEKFSDKETLDFFFPSKKTDALKPVEGATPLIDLLGGNKDCRKALCARLGNVFTVPTGKEATILAQKHSQYLFLSSDGELHGAGYCRTGMLTDADSVGLLARRNARESARVTLEAAEAEYLKAHELESQIHASLLETEKSIGELEQTHRENSSELERLEIRCQEQVVQGQRAEDEVAALTEESQQLSGLLERASAEESEATVSRDNAENDRLAKNVTLEKMQGEFEHAQLAYESVGAELQEARVDFNRCEQTKDHLFELAKEKEEHVKRSSSECVSLEEELVSMREKIVSIGDEIAQAKVNRTNLLSGRSDIGDRVDVANAQLQKASEALSLAREKRSGEQHVLDDLMEKRQALALEEQRVRMQYEELLRGIREEFSQDIEELALSLQISRDDPIPEGLSLESMHEEYEKLKAKTESIGSVNLEAVSELEEREERLNFLEKEQADLLQARAHLVETLETLDSQCRERFMETFEVVKTNFEATFRRFFGGGQANIQLTPEMDPLDAGIEINARPPGSPKVSLKQLSGGQRTLTAFSLLLAVFLSKPAPFCLLDEVDAALDDANTQRLVNAIKDFSESTQFLVITHNRITMSRCESLFGVTQRKAGVSMLVSVDLTDIPEEFVEQKELTIPDSRGQALQRATEAMDNQAKV